MKKLSDFPYVNPRDLDSAKPNWLCGPVGQTRDSDALARANFDAVIDRLDEIDPYGRTWEIIRFSHWAVGWIDEIFIEPDTRAAIYAAETKEGLARYPVIDEALWSEYAAEESAEEPAEEPADASE